MTYVIIVLVVALALAPLSHFLPSKSQRRQAALREAAAVAGLFVEFRRLPGESGASERLPSSGVIYYGLRLPPSRGRLRRRGAWLRDDGGWRAVGARVPLPAPLQDLPPVVLAASVDEHSCGIYWREEGDSDTVATIRGVLTQWAELLHS